MEGARQRRQTREGEDEMYGMLEQEISRQHRGEIRRQVAAIRLEKAARTNREGRFRVMRDTKWEVERYAGRLKKRLGNLG
jgi:hypothetical protein